MFITVTLHLYRVVMAVGPLSAVKELVRLVQYTEMFQLFPAINSPLFLRHCFAHVQLSVFYVDCC